MIFEIHSLSTNGPACKVSILQVERLQIGLFHIMDVISCLVQTDI